MVVARQLYQLQEVDLEVESSERTLGRKVNQLGENRTVVEAKTRLTSEQQRLEELLHKQHSAEWEIDDLVSKLTAAEEQLYSGRIKNPKELTGLQHEVDLLKGKRDRMENSALEIIDQVEAAEARVAAAESELRKRQAERESQQQQLSADIATLKNRIADLGQKRQALAVEISPQALEVYDRLRKQKGQAVARVEQGVCRGCRISLTSSEMQQVRSGNPVQCGSCGRILFLP